MSCTQKTHDEGEAAAGKLQGLPVMPVHPGARPPCQFMAADQAHSSLLLGLEALALTPSAPPPVRASSSSFETSSRGSFNSGLSSSTLCPPQQQLQQASFLARAAKRHNWTGARLGMMARLLTPPAPGGQGLGSPQPRGPAAGPEGRAPPRARVPVRSASHASLRSPYAQLRAFLSPTGTAAAAADAAAAPKRRTASCVAPYAPSGAGGFWDDVGGDSGHHLALGIVQEDSSVPHAPPRLLTAPLPVPTYSPGSLHSSEITEPGAEKDQPQHNPSETSPRHFGRFKIGRGSTLTPDPPAPESEPTSWNSGSYAAAAPWQGDQEPAPAPPSDLSSQDHMQDAGGLAPAPPPPRPSRSRASSHTLPARRSTESNLRQAVPNPLHGALAGAGLSHWDAAGGRPTHHRSPWLPPLSACGPLATSTSLHPGPPPASALRPKPSRKSLQAAAAAAAGSGLYHGSPQHSVPLASVLPNQPPLLAPKLKASSGQVLPTLAGSRGAAAPGPPPCSLEDCSAYGLLYCSTLAGHVSPQDPAALAPGAEPPAPGANGGRRGSCGMLPSRPSDPARRPPHRHSLRSAPEGDGGGEHDGGSSSGRLKVWPSDDSGSAGPPPAQQPLLLIGDEGGGAPTPGASLTAPPCRPPGALPLPLPLGRGDLKIRVQRGSGVAPPPPAAAAAAASPNRWAQTSPKLEAAASGEGRRWSGQVGIISVVAAAAGSQGRRASQGPVQGGAGAGGGGGQLSRQQSWYLSSSPGGGSSSGPDPGPPGERSSAGQWGRKAAPESEPGPVQAAHSKAKRTKGPSGWLACFGLFQEPRP